VINFILICIKLKHFRLVVSTESVSKIFGGENMDSSILEQEFDQKQIKQRKGPGGITLDYVETPSVIKRLNQAFDYQWSFDIEQFEKNDKEVVVLGKLTGEGISKMQFGSKAITNGKGEIGDDLKAAGSDALKKCATLFGIALHLYGGDEPSNNGNKGKGAGMAQVTPNKGNNKITKAQLAKIKELRTNLGWDGDEIKKFIKETHNMDNPLDMNPEQAKNIIAVLGKKVKEKTEAEKQEAEKEQAGQEEVI
jgi:hypothetical protein